MTHWAFAYPDEAAVRKAVRAKLVSMVPTGSSQTSKKGHEGVPNHFQDTYPLHVVSSTGTRGEHRSVDGMPERLLFNFRAIDVLVGASDSVNEEQGKRSLAEDTCMDIVSQFKQALSEDSDFFGRIRMGTSEAAPFDRAGNPRLDRAGNLLWVESLDFEIIL